MRSEHWAAARVESPSVERAVVRTLVSEVLADGAPALPPEEMFTAVCEVMVDHFSLTSAGLVKRVAGQSRAFVWSASGAASGRRVSAPDHAWASAADLLEVASRLEADGGVASAVALDERFGLSALLYVESRRRLDTGDRALLEEVLRRMLCLPSVDDARALDAGHRAAARCISATSCQMATPRWGG